MLRSMRTTISIDDRLWSEAKQFALRHRKSLKAVIEDALQEMLARQNSSTARTPMQLTTVTGKGLAPGINLDDSAGLREIMDNNARLQ